MQAKHLQMNKFNKIPSRQINPILCVCMCERETPYAINDNNENILKITFKKNEGF